jgi:hypothetical protein
MMGYDPYNKLTNLNAFTAQKWKYNKECIFFQAALIMQVLQLSDEQIAMLPPEQRQSILVLKEQIAKSTQR